MAHNSHKLLFYYLKPGGKHKCTNQGGKVTLASCAPLHNSTVQAEQGGVFTPSSALHTLAYEFQVPNIHYHVKSFPQALETLLLAHACGDWAFF